MTTGADVNRDGMRLAATVLLVRDGRDGVETLMMRRPSRGSFADAWVWPGGAVEPSDGDGADTANETAEQQLTRAAAVRELREETGLQVAGDRLHPYALWSPPLDSTPKFRTWFYVAAEFSGVIRPQRSEVAELAWVRPEEMLAAHERAERTLIVPTWVTLWQLTQLGSSHAVLEHTVHAPFEHYETRHAAPEQRFYWFGDSHWHTDELGEAGEHPGRHRLETARRPWRYIRDTGCS